MFFSIFNVLVENSLNNILMNTCFFLIGGRCVLIILVISGYFLIRKLFIKILLNCCCYCIFEIWILYLFQFSRLELFKINIQRLFITRRHLLLSELKSKLFICWNVMDLGYTRQFAARSVHLAANRETTL